MRAYITAARRFVTDFEGDALLAPLLPFCNYSRWAASSRKSKSLFQFLADLAQNPGFEPSRSLWSSPNDAQGGQKPFPDALASPERVFDRTLSLRCHSDSISLENPSHQGGATHSRLLNETPGFGGIWSCDHSAKSWTAVSEFVTVLAKVIWSTATKLLYFG